MTKIVTLGLLLFSTLLFGLIPIQFIRVIRRRQAGTRRFSRSRLEFVLSLLNCFAGGVFFGTTLLHLVPEVREDVVDMLQQYGQPTDFAVAEFIISGGFFIIMFLENLVMVAQHHNHHGEGFESIESSVVSCVISQREEEPINRKGKERRSYGATSSSGQTAGTSSPNSHADVSDTVHFHKDLTEDFEVSIETPGNPSSDSGVSKEAQKHDGSWNNSHEHRHHHHHKHDGHRHHHHDHHQVREAGKEHEGEDGHHCRHPPVIVEKGDCVHVIHPSHHQHHHMEPQQLASLRSFLLLLALSLHTVFEGLAIGLQPSNQAVWNLFIAIVVHKTIIAFSMGIQFAENLKTYTNAVIFIVLFAFMSPLGIAIGTGVFALQGPGDVSLVVSVVLQGIAAGTFLYVTFFEVLNKEVGQDHSLLKVLFILLGFGAMVLLNLFNGEPEH